jgi:mannan endo-1,4-beta-mannosidase
MEHEQRGYANLQTVSIFGPELIRHPALVEPIFRHPTLDFANTHLYEHGTIDDPHDTVAPALAAARLMQAAVEATGSSRPVFDSEHGPIHSFKDRKRTLSSIFDDEYFRHIQWAHLASGGAGGGMRWPNRHPHVLTPGMREAQRALADFLPEIDWTAFRRLNRNADIRCDDTGVAIVGCGDDAQALVWLVRTDTITKGGMLGPSDHAKATTLTIPGLADGHYAITTYDTFAGTIASRDSATSVGGVLVVGIGPVRRDLAVAIRRTAEP